VDNNACYDRLPLVLSVNTSTTKAALSLSQNDVHHRHTLFSDVRQTNTEPRAEQRLYRRRVAATHRPTYSTHAAASRRASPIRWVLSRTGFSGKPMATETEAPTKKP